MNVPQFIKQFLDGDERGAYETMRQNNIFPEVCAWLCPVEEQCQGHCLMKFIGDGPLPIADIQRYLAEQANRNGWSRLRLPPKAISKRIAVIGAGPAGLACAAKLLEAGYYVTVYDKSHDAGGMVESVIPPERQNSSLVNEIGTIFKDLPSGRSTFLFNKGLSAEWTLDTVLSQGFDAVFLGMGLPKSVAGAGQRQLVGLWGALDFLNAAKREKQWSLAGEVVAVIGGGNTAMDAAVTARRLGARDVYLIYRRSFEQMPAWPAERDGALNAGVHFLILTQQLDYIEKDGRVAGIKLCPTRLGEADASGRRAPVALPGGAYILQAEVVVEAIGQEAAEGMKALLPGVEIEKGLIKTLPGSNRTTREKVYAGGDLVRGASTVVAAVADGMCAAREIDAMLRSKRSEGAA
jgi:glutamate synthase (NADPH/NADH) small chain